MDVNAALVRSWNSAGRENTVTPGTTGKYAFAYPGMPSANLAIHVTAIGSGAGHCRIEFWNATSVNIGCYDASGAPANSAFSVMTSTGATRSGPVGGHVWVNGATSAPASLQAKRSTSTCWGSPSTVSGYSNGYYPDTAHSPAVERFPFTTATSLVGPTFCKAESWSTDAIGTNVHRKCFTNAGVPTSVPFLQSFVSLEVTDPC